MTPYLNIFFLAVSLTIFSETADARKIEFKNKCSKDIWISPLTNDNKAALPDGIVKIAKGASHSYNIPDAGWSGRFWPKTGCKADGQGCQTGQSVAPCNSGGCDPPADTKVEFHFPAQGGTDKVWYDVSLVDGYSLSVEIIPSALSGTCVKTDCSVSLNDCPTDEKDVANLKVVKNSETVACLSPCKKWNYTPPFGLGKNEKDAPGVNYCCPTPPIQPKQCSNGPVKDTKYVKLIQKVCPTAYSYAYDDKAALHTCPVDTSFTVNFCN